VPVGIGPAGPGGWPDSLGFVPAPRISAVWVWGIYLLGKGTYIAT
jgi:hypothetical protein